jgi:hypothetical protein
MVITMKLCINIITILVFSSFSSESLAGRHDQSTHTTPKGYHHDGTYHYGESGDLIFMVLAVVAAIGSIFFLIVKSSGKTGSNIDRYRNVYRDSHGKLYPSKSHRKNSSTAPEEPIDWEKIGRIS